MGGGGGGGGYTRDKTTCTRTKSAVGGLCVRGAYLQDSMVLLFNGSVQASECAWGTCMCSVSLRSGLTYHTIIC